MTLSGNQIEFIQTLIENLTSTGVVDSSRFYETPYTRFRGRGVDGVFRETEVVRPIEVLEEVRLRAVA